MIEEVVKDYSAYFNLDLTSNLQTVQDVIDNMITRLEELTSVLHMVKTKNNECCSTVTNDISRHRNEITILTKKIAVLSEVISKLQTNIEILERKVDRAENDFGITQFDNKLKILFRPFLKRSKEVPSDTAEPLESSTVNLADYFENR